MGNNIKTKKTKEILNNLIPVPNIYNFCNRGLINLRNNNSTNNSPIQDNVIIINVIKIFL